MNFHLPELGGNPRKEGLKAKVFHYCRVCEMQTKMRPSQFAKLSQSLIYSNKRASEQPAWSDDRKKWEEGRVVGQKEHDDTSQESGVLCQAQPQTSWLFYAGNLPCVSPDPFSTLSTHPAVCLGGCSLWTESRAAWPSGFWVRLVSGSHWQEIRREEGGMDYSWPQPVPSHSPGLAGSTYRRPVKQPLSPFQELLFPFALSAQGVVMAPSGCEPWEYWAILFIFPEPCPHLSDSV